MPEEADPGLVVEGELCVDRADGSREKIDGGGLDVSVTDVTSDAEDGRRYEDTACCW